MSPATPVIFLTGHGTVAKAVDALKQGVFDYLIKPFSAQQLIEVVRKATELCPDHQGSGKFYICTRNTRMQQILDLAYQAALSNAPVLIEAESGTGKELFARYIHGNSTRSEHPFVAVNCAAVPEELLESELFGYEKGAFTGALRAKPGKFELAHLGTILLDEIGEMSPRLQAKLLRVLQEGQIDPVGGVAPLDVDVRVISTTNRNLRQAIEETTFREDLYYRLNVIPLTIPPLRRRKEDVSLLVNHFSRKYEREGRASEFSADALQALQHYDWPGNVRELENVTRRALVLGKNPLISPADLFMEPAGDSSAETQLQAGTPLSQLEKQMIRMTLEKTDGNRTRAAEMLGISLRTLRNKLREYRKDGNTW